MLLSIIILASVLVLYHLWYKNADSTFTQGRAKSGRFGPRSYYVLLLGYPIKKRAALNIRWMLAFILIVLIIIYLINELHLFER